MEELEKVEEKEEEKEEIEMRECYLCGKLLPIDQLHDDGNDLVCEDCL